MDRYRTTTCERLRREDAGRTVKVAGWLHRKRDHGKLVFLELRDHYGITQCVVTEGAAAMPLAESLRLESVVSITGKVVERDAAAINPAMSTGEIEVAVESIELLSPAAVLPFQVSNPQEIPEEARLRYRFLDLRRARIHRNVGLRAQVIASLRQRMTAAGFMEFQTPILTSSSPEGARDYLVPSRLHPGKFYALPQAPQQFKQLLMVAGFDRYFQIAPCFRDEDARADRSPGEFYQLDVEMSFVEQDDVFTAIEPVLHGVYQEFAPAGTAITPAPFPRIAYRDAMLKYGSDKPDLRNPIEIADVTELFRGGAFKAFASAVERGSVVRAIPAPAVGDKARSFFDKVVEKGKELGLPGVAYVIFPATGEAPLKGTIARLVDDAMRARLAEATGVAGGDALFFVCDTPRKVDRPAGGLRAYLGAELDLLEKNAFRFCWVVDFPFYELEPETNAVGFSHNPFSMPQGGLEALETEEPLSILAHQYDIVCNGVELSSGAIRNHRPDIMLRAFAIAGYAESEVEQRFGGMLNAFRFGAPPHGGLAPGVDRIVMQLANEPNIREVIAFPMTQHAEDLMMNAPSPVRDEQLRELHIRLAPRPEE
jgi:aspartyl-tRNA synthetase